jgi:hypothetical protein
MDPSATPIPPGSKTKNPAMEEKEKMKNAKRREFKVWN